MRSRAPARAERRFGQPRAPYLIEPLTSLSPSLLRVFIFTLDFSLWPSVPEIFFHAQIRLFHPAPKMLRGEGQIRIPAYPGTNVSNVTRGGNVLTDGRLHGRREALCCRVSLSPPYPLFLKKMYIAAVTISRFGFFPLPPERGRGQKALLFGSARPYLCLAPAPRPGQHPRTLGQCHVCHPTGNGVSPALTWPDRCVPQAGDLTQGSFMDVVDTERSKGERGGERAGVPRWACFAPHKRVKRPRRSPPPHPSFLSAGKCF